MASITYDNPDFPQGEEVYVKDLGTLINGQSVEFSDEQVARYESLRGEGAFSKISHTDRYDESLFDLSEKSEPVEEVEPATPFPSPVAVPTETPEGGNE